MRSLSAMHATRAFDFLRAAQGRLEQWATHLLPFSEEA